MQVGRLSRLDSKTSVVLGEIVLEKSIRLDWPVVMVSAEGLDRMRSLPCSAVQHHLTEGQIIVDGRDQPSATVRGCLRTRRGSAKVLAVRPSQLVEYVDGSNGAPGVCKRMGDKIGNLIVM